MRIGIIGAGVSGLVAAYLLRDEHEVTVFESAGYAGGHACTLDVEQAGRRYDVDTGFVVYNETTYPNFVRLLERLGVESRPTEMSFSVHCERSGWEFSGASLDSLFAQRRNALRPSFYRMLFDIVRFNRSARRLLQRGVDAPTLGDYLERHRYSQAFIERYILPMGSAIWSSSPRQILEFPASFFLRFFDNHGLLSVTRHLQWRVIRGGSRRYVAALTRSFGDRIRLNTPVRHVVRRDGSVEVQAQDGPALRFDRVILATHADQALRLLADASEREHEVLGALGYHENDTVLHTDASLLPRRRRAWASWNYHVLAGRQDRVVATYNMSTLQGLDSPAPFCVTLNRGEEIDETKVLRRMSYAHPVFSPAAIAAQSRREEIDGAGPLHFCGAYWGNGFHEDGVNSALHVCRRFGATLR